MAFNINDWNIQSRAQYCAVTARSFEEGETVHSCLYWKDGAYQRIDMCEEAWKQRNDNIAPISAWQFPYEPPAPPPPEPLKKDDAESLLRHLMQENDPAKRNARYILALMLERKRILKMLDRKKNGDETILIYEHAPTGETWLIQDPNLKLAELEPVQNEVATLLHTAGPTPTAQPAPVTAAVESENSEAPPVENVAEEPQTEAIDTTDETKTA